MAQALIRNIDDELLAEYREAAKSNGRSQTLHFPLIAADEKLWKRTRDSLFADHVIMLRDWKPSDD